MIYVNLKRKNDGFFLWKKNLFCDYMNVYLVFLENVKIIDKLKINMFLEWRFYIVIMNVIYFLMVI